MEYISTKEAAARWKLSVRQVQNLCESGKVKGARRFCFCWMIPKETKKPIDGRTLRYQRSLGRSPAKER